MTRRAAGLALLLASAGPLGAQVVADVEPGLRIATAYEGRGLTFHEGLAAQLTLDLVLRVEGSEVRAGAWTNAELLRDDAGLTMLADEAPGLSEVNLYLSASRTVGTVTWTGGWIYFLWPTGFDFSDASPLHEVFIDGSASLPFAGATAGVRAYYDFIAGGAYGELSAAAPLRDLMGIAPDLALTLGWVVDQEEYYARRDGLTHLGVVLGFERPGRWTRVRPELHWTVALDPAARAGAWTHGGRHKLHVGLRITPR